MKQLSIFCSRDLEERVVAALDRAGAEGFFRVGHGTGNKFTPAAAAARVFTWDAALLVVPAIADERVDGVIVELEKYAGSCEVRPCLRIVVSAVERVV